MFRRALTEQCLHWSSFPTGEAEGAFAGGHEDLLVGEAHGKADGGVEVGGFEDLEVASMVPPCASTARLTIESPSPVPLVWFCE